MLDLLHKKIPFIYWSIILLDCIFLHFNLPYSAITESLAMPLLILYLTIKDVYILRPPGKFFFYIGLIFAFFGDVSQLAITNQVFLTTSIIAFILMNVCYSIFFLYLAGLRLKLNLAVILTIIILWAVCYTVLYFTANAIGSLKPLIIAYMILFGTSFTLSVNVAAIKDYRSIAANYFIPGMIAFLALHIILGLTLFYFSYNADVYAGVVLIYGFAQYRLCLGMLKIYPPEKSALPM